MTRYIVVASVCLGIGIYLGFRLGRKPSGSLPPPETGTSQPEPASVNPTIRNTEASAEGSVRWPA
jgi:hypothetical protein